MKPESRDTHYSPETTMSETTQCPHCKAPVPRGATVCTGCQAEVDYGVPKWLFWFNVIAAIVVAAVASAFTQQQLVVVASGGLSYLLAHVASAMACRKRVVFVRRYRTLGQSACHGTHHLSGVRT